MSAHARARTPAPAPPTRRPDPSPGRTRIPDRLWPSLAMPINRPQPAKGFDLFGERLAGAAARRRRVTDLRRRAVAIAREAAAMKAHSHAAFADAVARARDRFLIARNRPGDAEIAASFAVAAEAIRRTLGLTLHDEQIMGALAMAAGCCAEMATGEGKTVTAILPAALHGWAGRGVHVLTVNDYLAKRDAALTTPVYHLLGLSVGVVQDGSRDEERRLAYSRSVTYAADKQAVFDHLRDRLRAPLRPTLAGHLLDQVLKRDDAWRPAGRRDWGDELVQRGLFAAVVDEADSILIDEAVTPAIIAATPESGGPWGGEEQYRTAAAIAAALSKGEHYTLDPRLRAVRFTEAGRDELARRARGETGEGGEAGGSAKPAGLPPFWTGPRRREEIVAQALSARELYIEGDDYIIREGKIVIVDRSTGRVLEGRQWQLGVHQAVEAKHGIEITDARATSARTSYMRFFQRYARLCGMTGTARETRHELWRDYRLPVIPIPTHKPVLRRRRPDRVFTSETRKFEAVAARVAELHAHGRPVLVGTRSVASSERLGALLATRGVPCRILNAVREAEEAAIVAEAGKAGAVTVATNMAGRGTDITLTDETRAAGGLAVIATERHDEGRVDRQLFGRAGRQGDPGSAQAFVSLDDALIQRTGLPPLAALVRWTGLAGPLGRPLSWLLWRTAQGAAGRRAAMTRREAARHEAWLDLAMHHETR